MKKLFGLLIFLLIPFVTPIASDLQDCLDRVFTTYQADQDACFAQLSQPDFDFPLCMSHAMADYNEQKSFCYMIYY